MASRKPGTKNEKLARADFGTVLAVDPVRQTATVESDQGKPYPDCGIGLGGPANFSTPEPGWLAEVSEHFGLAQIERYLTGSGSPEYPERDPAGQIDSFVTMTGGIDLYRQIAGKRLNFRDNRPVDLIAGDQGFRSSDGAMVFAGRGPIAGMKVSDLCQLLLNAVDDHARLIGRNLEIMTDWGQLRFENAKGQTRLILRGAGQADKTYDERLDFELKLGGPDTADDPFLQLALYDRKGRAEGAGDGDIALAVRADQRGQISLFSAGDRWDTVHGQSVATVTRSEKRIIGDSASHEIDGDLETIVGNEHQLRARNSIETLAGHASPSGKMQGKVINAPAVALGSEEGQAAPMGETLKGFLESLVDCIQSQILVIQGKPGTLLPVPGVPGDLLSDVVTYPQKPRPAGELRDVVPSPATRVAAPAAPIKWRSLEPTVVIPSNVFRMLISAWAIQSNLGYGQLFPAEHLKPVTALRRDISKNFGGTFDPEATELLRQIATQINDKLRTLGWSFRMARDIHVFTIKKMPAGFEAFANPGERWIMATPQGAFRTDGRATSWPMLQNQLKNKPQDVIPLLNTLVHELVHCSMSIVLTNWLYHESTWADLGIIPGVLPLPSGHAGTLWGRVFRENQMESLTDYLSFILTGLLVGDDETAYATRKTRRGGYTLWPNAFFARNWGYLVNEILASHAGNSTSVGHKLLGMLSKWGIRDTDLGAARASHTVRPGTRIILVEELPATTLVEDPGGRGLVAAGGTMYLDQNGDPGRGPDKLGAGTDSYDLPYGLVDLPQEMIETIADTDVETFAVLAAFAKPGEGIA